MVLDEREDQTMAEELKQIPDTGTRLNFARLVGVALSTGYVMTTIAVLNDLMTADQVALVGVTFERWWIGIGSTLLVYTGSENFKKHSIAVLNK